MRYKHPSHRKSLLHFDFPYYGEPGDGLRDEIGVLAWARMGGAKLVGVEEPVAENVAGTPKFGYRCLQTATNADYLSASNNGNVIPTLCLNGDREYEFEFFVRPTAATAGNIVVIRDESGDLFSITKDASNKIAISGMGISLTSSVILALNQFTHALVRLARGTASVYVGGQAAGTTTGFSGSISATGLRVGGVAGQIDEFLFSHRAGTSTPTVPTHPYQGTIDYRTLGGFGDGRHGNVDLSGLGQSVNLNTYAIVSGISSTQIYIGTQAVGMFGEFEAGDEIMIHHSLKRDASSADEQNIGLYSIRRIKSIEGTRITLDRAIDEFTFQGSAYYIQAVKIPNFASLTIPEGVTVKPPAWNNTKGGGIVAIKCKGYCNIQGKIISATTGAVRTDNHSLTHSDMIDRFILAGNVFIMCGDFLSVGSNARIGSDFDGSGKGGLAQKAGGAANQTAKPGLLGVGGSSGVGRSYEIPGGRPGFGGNGGVPSEGTLPARFGAKGKPAPNVILIGRVVSANTSAISTGGGGGGGGGNGTRGSGGGGGGGFDGAGGTGESSYYNGGAGAGTDGVGKAGLETYPGGLGGGSGYGGAGGSSLDASGGSGSGTGFCFIAETRGA